MTSWLQEIAGYLMGIGIGMIMLLLCSFLPACFGFKWTRKLFLELIGLGVAMIGVSLRFTLAYFAVETGDIVEVIDTVVILGGVVVLTVGLTRAYARHRARVDSTVRSTKGRTRFRYIYY